MHDCFGVGLDPEEVGRWDDLWLVEFMQGKFESDLPRSDRFRVSDIEREVPSEEFFGVVAPGLFPETTDLRHVMEFGCGPGRLARRYLVSDACRYVGLDVSRLAIAVAQHRFHRDDRVEVLHTVDDAERCQELEGFTLVFSHTAFMHLPLERAVPTLSWLIERLAPGGMLSVDVRIGEDAPEAPQVEDWVPGARWNTFPHQQKELVSAARQKGLEAKFAETSAQRGYVIGRKPE